MAFAASVIHFLSLLFTACLFSASSLTTSFSEEGNAHCMFLHFNRGFLRVLLMGCTPSLLFCHLKAHPTLPTKCWSGTEVHRVGLRVAGREWVGEGFFL